MNVPEILFYILLALVLVALAFMALARLVRSCTPRDTPLGGFTPRTRPSQFTAPRTFDDRRSSDDGIAQGLMLGLALSSPHSHDSTPVSHSMDSHSGHSDTSSSSDCGGCDGGGGD